MPMDEKVKLIYIWLPGVRKFLATVPLDVVVRAVNDANKILLDDA